MTKLSRMTALFVLAILISGFLGGACFAVSRNGNLEYWQKQTISVKLNEKWSAYVAEEFKLGRENGNPYSHNVDGGLVYKGLADWLDIAMSFKKEWEQDSAGDYRHENRPHLNVIVKGKVGNVAVSNRSRLEWRNREHKEDYFRFRNQTAFKFPVKLTRFNFQPYISEEWFVHLGENNIDQNRLTAGVSWPITKNIKSSLYYMWKAGRSKNGGWGNTNVIGTDFKFLF